MKKIILLLFMNIFYCFNLVSGPWFSKDKEPKHEQLKDESEVHHNVPKDPVFAFAERIEAVLDPQIEGDPEPNYYVRLDNAKSVGAIKDLNEEYAKKIDSMPGQYYIQNKDNAYSKQVEIGKNLMVEYSRNRKITKLKTKVRIRHIYLIVARLIAEEKSK